MTTPYERTRALIETKEFLQKLTDPGETPRMPKSVRQHAQYLLRHFPSYADVELAHKARPEVFGPVPPFSRAHMKTAITELGLDEIASKNGP